LKDQYWAPLDIVGFSGLALPLFLTIYDDSPASPTDLSSVSIKQMRRIHAQAFRMMSDQ
jgi:hypothetical protein